MTVNFTFLRSNYARFFSAKVGGDRPKSAEHNGTATINRIFPSGPPDCSAVFGSTFYGVLPGTYSYTASCSGGRRWSGSVTVVKDGSTCYLVKLE